MDLVREDLALVADEQGSAEPADEARAQALRLFDELHSPLYRYLVCAGTSAADAEDAVQETFLRLYRHLEKGGETGNLAGWVFQVARNVIRDERKSARWRRTVPLDGEIVSAAASDGVSAIEGAAGPDPEAMREAIARLPEPARECMLLRASGLKYREIADIMSTTTSNIGSLVHRAVARLKADLNG